MGSIQTPPEEPNLARFAIILAFFWRYFVTPSTHACYFEHARRDSALHAAPKHRRTTHSADFNKAGTSIKARAVAEHTTAKGEIDMSTAETPALNMDKLNAFIGQFVTD